MNRCASILLSASVLYGSLAPAAAPPPPAASKHTLLMILLDGMRWDGVDAQTTPNLHRLAQAGVRGEMIPVWPTISSPNHWAMSTGLYPIHGGVYDNIMYDPVAGKKFDRTKNEGWGLGEPVWAAVSRQNGISGVIAREGWAGSQVTEGPNRPTFRVPYYLAENGRDNRAPVTLGILDQDAPTRPDLLMLYAIEVDHAQHMHGVNSLEAKQARQMVDRMVGEIVDGLKARGLSGSVDILIVSDHGVLDIGERQTVFIEDLVDVNDLAVPPLGGLIALWPKKDKYDTVYNKVRTAHPHIRAVRPQDIPKDKNCCEPNRAPPILLLPDPGWVVDIRSEISASRPLLKATHIYDNALREMHPIFIAAGPSIRQGVKIAPFSSVDIYSLAVELLKIEPAKNDGSLKALCPILKNASRACEASGGR